jgi:hypothetical protein
MSQTINVNGVSINYPETGDTNWSDEATNFAVQTSSALGKIGLSSGTSVDVVGTLDVTLATTLDSTLTVAGTTTLNGTANLNGNTNLGNATSDTIAVTGILNVDSGVLYVDPTGNLVGINKTNPAQALDVVGNSAISGNETVGGTLNVTGNVTLTADLNVNGNTTIGNASGDTTTINGTAISVPNGLNIDSNTLVIDATNDRVGIKTASPTVELDITGAILSSGNITTAGVLTASNSTNITTAPPITFTGDTNTGIGHSSADTLDFVTNAVSRARISSTGLQSSVIPDLSGSNTTLFPEYKCRAWVNFNGTTATPSTIRGSGNVSSVTKVSTGIYTVNIDIDMPDANYAVSIMQGGTSSVIGIRTQEDVTARTAGAFTFVVFNSTFGTADASQINVAVFR